MRWLKYIAIIALFLAFIVLIVRCTNSSAKNHIEDKVESLGGEFISYDSRWSNGPFWYRAKGQHIYSFIYTIDGVEYEGWVRTGGLFGPEWRLDEE